MKTLLLALSLSLILPISALAADDAAVSRCKQEMGEKFNEGMWTFDNLPRERIEKLFGFKITDEWVNHVMKASVRFNTGGSGSWVSPDGLVMTNHHVAAPTLHDMSSAEHDYIKTGYLARTHEKEIRAKHLEINQLMSIENVTSRVLGAIGPGMSPGEAKIAKDKAIAAIEKDSEKATGLKSDVVTLYQGGQYHLYRYKKYTDVRLVFAPEKEIAYFGGDLENFEYPREDLDVAYFRIYENGNPVKPEHYFTWKEEGAKEGELIFISGNPGSTKRLYTADHMISDRDVALPNSVELISRRMKNIEAYMKLGPEQKRQGLEEYFSLANSYKVRRGEVEGLASVSLDVINQKRKADEALKAKIKERPELTGALSAWDDIKRAELYAKQIQVPIRYLEGAIGIDSDFFSLARQLVRMAAEDEKLNVDRLPEYQDARRESLVEKITSDIPFYKSMQEFKLADSLRYMSEKLGPTHAIVQRILEGKSPEQRAKELVEGTQLDSAKVRAAYIKGGKSAIEKSTDPFILLALALDQKAREVRKNYEANVTSPEELAYERIAAAKFAIEGTSQYPDATFSPRLAFGTVRGYSQSNVPVPSHTTIGDAFEQEAKYKSMNPADVPPIWEMSRDFMTLPNTWHANRDKLNMLVPFNQVSVLDTIGGNSGSPVFNENAQIVGLLFDGNRYSHVRRYAYTTSDENPARAVTVHPGVISHVLEKVYGAFELVKELLGK